MGEASGEGGRGESVGQSLIQGCGLPAAVLAESVVVSGTWNYGSYPATNVTHKPQTAKTQKPWSHICWPREELLGHGQERVGRCLLLS